MAPEEDQPACAPATSCIGRSLGTRTPRRRPSGLPAPRPAPDASAAPDASPARWPLRRPPRLAVGRGLPRARASPRARGLADGVALTPPPPPRPSRRTTPPGTSPRPRPMLLRRPCWPSRTSRGAWRPSRPVPGPRAMTPAPAPTAATWGTSRSDMVAEFADPLFDAQDPSRATSSGPCAASSAGTSSSSTRPAARWPERLDEVKAKLGGRRRRLRRGRPRAVRRRGGVQRRRARLARQDLDDEARLDLTALDLGGGPEPVDEDVATTSTSSSRRKPRGRSTYSRRPSSGRPPSTTGTRRSARSEDGTITVTVDLFSNTPQGG